MLSRAALRLAAPPVRVSRLVATCLPCAPTLVRVAAPVDTAQRAGITLRRDLSGSAAQQRSGRRGGGGSAAAAAAALGAAAVATVAVAWTLAPDSRAWAADKSDAQREFSYDEVKEQLSAFVKRIRHSSVLLWPSIGLRKREEQSLLGTTESFSIIFNVAPSTDMYRLLEALTANVGYEFEMSRPPIVGEEKHWDGCIRFVNRVTKLSVTIRRRTRHRDPEDKKPSQLGAVASVDGDDSDDAQKNRWRQQFTEEVVVEFDKPRGGYTQGELEAIKEAYALGAEKIVEAVAELDRLGLEIYTPERGVDWAQLAGYEGVKAELQSSVMHPLQHPEIYEGLARATRTKPETIRPRAVLFEGPPGTGKTTSARIIASSVRMPLVYVPIENLMSPYYGETMRRLAKVFESVARLGPAIVFIDEIDSLASSRSGEMHEGTRRMLSVLLRELEGLVRRGNTLLIGATNRKADLDPALLSRFDVSISFPLPSEAERRHIFHHYAKQLADSEALRLARESEGFCGRDIKDACAHAERSWATRIIRQEVAFSTPPLDSYIAALRARRSALAVEAAASHLPLATSPEELKQALKQAVRDAP
jgi:Cdc6-like AAA superfamily ATPase